MKLALITLAIFAVTHGAVLPRHATNFGLHEDLQDFLNLVPVDKVVGIALDYLANDAEVQEVFEYAQSDDFKQLIQDLDKVPEFIEILNYLQENHIDVYRLVNAFHDILGIDKLPVPQRRVARRGQGVSGLLNDILAVLSMDEIKALFYEKLATSPEFVNFEHLLNGKIFRDLIETLSTNSNFQEIVERARANGIDVDDIIDILGKYFGWVIVDTRSATTFGLHEDLQDFLNLVPVDKVVGIALDYLANDAEVQEVFEYAQSDDFKQLIQDLDKVPEFIEILNYLQENHIDVYRLVNAFHDILGIDKLPVPQRSVACKGQGVSGLLNDILAVLPMDEIKALFYEKLATSPEFVNFEHLLNGKIIRDLIETLSANSSFQEIIERARANGIDVDDIIAILDKYFGWVIVDTRSATTFGLQEDLQDFLNLVPIDKVVGIALDYLANDAEFQEVFEYVQSDDFKQLVQDVDKVPEYIEFLNYLQSQQIDVYKVINAFHDFLGLDNLPVPQSRVARRGQGMRGFLDDILAVLPLDEIKALYYEKLETSPEFVNLEHILQGKTVRDLVEKLRANPTFQEIVERARAHGIDVDHIVEILNKIFGWGIETIATL